MRAIVQGVSVHRYSLFDDLLGGLIGRHRRAGSGAAGAHLLRAALPFVRGCVARGRRVRVGLRFGPPLSFS